MVGAMQTVMHIKEPLVMHVAGYRNPKWKLMATLSGYHNRTIYTVDWSSQDLIATGRLPEAHLSSHSRISG